MKKFLHAELQVSKSSSFASLPSVSHIAPCSGRPICTACACAGWRLANKRCHAHLRRDDLPGHMYICSYIVVCPSPLQCLARERLVTAITITFIILLIMICYYLLFLLLLLFYLLKLWLLILIILFYYDYYLL
jgi:hypothetical protein